MAVGSVTFILTTFVKSRTQPYDFPTLPSITILKQISKWLDFSEAVETTTEMEVVDFLEGKSASLPPGIRKLMLADS